MTIRMTKKNSEIAKGAGTAAREAVKDAKALEEKKQKELQERENEILFENKKPKSNDAERTIRKQKDNFGELTSLVVVPNVDSGKDVHLIPEQDLKDIVWNNSSHLVLESKYKDFDVRKVCFGWVAYKDALYPSYDLSVYSKDGKHYAKSNTEEGIAIPIEELSSVQIHSSKMGITYPDEFDISNTLSWNGVNIVPGNGLKFVSDLIHHNVIDLSNLKLSRDYTSSNKISSYVIYNIASGNDISEYRLSELMGVSDIFGGDIDEYVEFNYVFTEGDMDPMNFNYIKEAISGQTFYVPREMVSQAKAICNAIESDSVTLSQLKKLSHILKVKFTVVPEEYVSGTALIKLPKVNDGNKERYEATDMTQNEYKLLSEGGMEVPIGAYGFAELYAAFESGNYESKDVQYLVDLLRRYTALDENNNK
nr:MAG TPA: hypothetical protein [Caudoviricetes sp.]